MTALWRGDNEVEVEVDCNVHHAVSPQLVALVPVRLPRSWLGGCKSGMMAGFQPIVITPSA